MNNIDWPVLLVWTLLVLIGALFWITIGTLVWAELT